MDFWGFPYVKSLSGSLIMIFFDCLDVLIFASVLPLNFLTSYAALVGMEITFAFTTFSFRHFLFIFLKSVSGSCCFDWSWNCQDRVTYFNLVRLFFYLWQLLRRLLAPSFRMRNPLLEDLLLLVLIFLHHTESKLKFRPKNEKAGGKGKPRLEKLYNQLVY